MGEKPKFIPAETNYGFGENKPKKFLDDGMGRAWAASERSRVYLSPEENRRAQEEAAKIAELRQQLEDARFEADQSYGDQDAAQRVRDLDQQLADLSSGNIEKTVIVEPLPTAIVNKKKGFFARLLGK